MLKYILPAAMLAAASVASSLAMTAPAEAQGYVSGHYRSNGTYVNSYYRGRADGQTWNNKNGR